MVCPGRNRVLPRADHASTKPFVLKRLLRHRLLQGGMAVVLGAYLEFALRTTRWTIDGADHLEPYATGRPAVFAFWHERLPLMPAMWLHARRLAGLRLPMAHVLVSRHRDGRFIGTVLRRFRVGVLHGSTSNGRPDRGGAAGLRQMLARLGAGELIVLTPDGPRGPRRVAAPGVAHLAALAGVPVLPCAAQTNRRHVLARSWDRMVLPLPWGRGVIVCGAPIAVARDRVEEALGLIAAALSDAADRADALCA